MVRIGSGRLDPARDRDRPTRVAVFTDANFSHANGLTTTLSAVLAHAPANVSVRVYTASLLHIDCPDFLSAPSISVPIRSEAFGRVYWPRLRRFARALEQDGIDVVHVSTTGPVGLAGRLLANWLGLPLTGSCHVLQEACQPSRASWRHTHRHWCYNRARVLLVPSRACGAQFESDPRLMSDLRLWPAGVDAETFSPDCRSQRLRAAWRADDQRRPIILCTGRLREPDRALLASVERLLYAASCQHRVVWIGDGLDAVDGPGPCADAVVLESPSAADRAAIMASADVLLSMGATDAGGLDVLEAQACGVPAVVGRRDPGGELVSSGETGCVAQRGDAADLADQLRRLLAVPAERRRMGANARAFALQRPWTRSLIPVVAAWREAAHAPATAAAGEYRLSADPQADETFW